MTLKKQIIALIAAASLAGPAAANTVSMPLGFTSSGIFSVLMGLLLPAVQVAREAPRR